MRKLLFLFILAMSTTAKADAPAFELSVAPGLSYSSYSGVRFSLGAALGVALSERWQIEAGGYIVSGNSSYPTFSMVRIGPQFNFDPDWSRSWYIGAGAGYANHFPYSDDDGSAFGYGRVGKRFVISEGSTTVVYSPYGEFIAGRGASYFTAQLLNFSIWF